jgi:hypothetical protein
LGDFKAGFTIGYYTFWTKYFIGLTDLTRCDTIFHDEQTKINERVKEEDIVKVFTNEVD